MRQRNMYSTVIYCTTILLTVLYKRSATSLHPTLVISFPSVASAWLNTVPGDVTKLQPRVQPQTKQRESKAFADNPC